MGARSVLSEGRTDRSYRRGFYLGLLVAGAVYLGGLIAWLIAASL